MPSDRLCAFLLIASGVTVVSPLSANPIDFGERTASMWEFEEWSVENPSWRGNPFDVEATVTFEHPQQTLTSQMFYDGDDTWTFRFTGTRTGSWTWSTSSRDPELDGHSGTVTVRQRASPEIKGFLASSANKFAIMEEDFDDRRGYLYNVFMNQQDFEQQYPHASRILSEPARVSLVDDYWRNTRDNGFNIYFFAVFYSWFRMGALSIEDFSSEFDPALNEPDLDLFRTLEAAILHAHQRGGRTHIWAWGDDGRKQTPNHLAGGFRGSRHYRLIRYIAARLGPLPGWSMNIGFDTIEMPDAKADASWWAEQLNDLMGWPHLLSSRGWDDDRFGIHSYAGLGSGYELITSKQGPVDYAEIRAALDARTNKPHIYEERHTYNRWSCWPTKTSDPNRLAEDGSRRLIWWQAMAGGMGGFFGHFSERFNRWGPFEPDGPCGYHPESLKQAFRTHRAFWKSRFRLDMTPGTDRVAGDRSYALVSSDLRHFVFFAEEAQKISIDLTGMPATEPVVAVDARSPYREIDHGRLAPGKHILDLGLKSDWAIAIGSVEASVLE